jgi:two-component system response regulator CpxR
MTQKRSQIEFEEMVKEISKGQYEVLGSYVDALTKIYLRCNICGYKFQMRPSRFLEGGRCKMCKKLHRLGLFDFVVSRKPLYRILVVDDDPTSLEFCKNILLKAEYDVTTCAKGEAAIKLFEKNPFDLILLDLFLSDIDGLQMLVKLGEKFQNFNAITMSKTGNYPSEFKRLFYSTKMIGASDVLEKPFTEAQLIEKVKEVLTKNMGMQNKPVK